MSERHPITKPTQSSSIEWPSMKTEKTREAEDERRPGQDPSARHANTMQKERFLNFAAAQNLVAVLVEIFRQDFDTFEAFILAPIV